jgi:hydrogenase-1 operon protein HyaE
MHDWADYVAHVGAALAMPVSRAPTIGIAVVSADAGHGGCH